MEKLVCAIVACAFGTLLHGQNLVPNPSFEEYVNCPNDYGESFELLDWFAAFGSPDYYNACDGYSDTCGVPMNVSGFQYPGTGDGYIGMATYSNDPPDGFRELIGVKLTTPIISGVTYYSSFKVSCTNGYPNVDNWTRYASNMLGVRIREDSVVGLSWFPIDNIAQLASDSIVTDSSGWALLSGSFVAQTSAQWLYLGNFFDHASVSIIVTDPNCPDEVGYYYFDDVCLSTVPGDCPMVNGAPELPQRDAPHAWVVLGSDHIIITGLDLSRLNYYQLYDVSGRLMAHDRLSAEGTIPLSAKDQLVVLRLWDGSEEWRYKLPVLQQTP